MKNYTSLLTCCVVTVVSTVLSSCHDHPLDGGGNEERTCKDVSLMAGVDDNFDPSNEENASPSEEMLAYMDYQYRILPNNPKNQLTTRFDETIVNRAFGHTFRLPDENIASVQSAVLTVHLRSLGGTNDAMTIADVTGKTDTRSHIWGAALSTLYGAPWTQGSEFVLKLDLAAVEPWGDHPTNLLYALEDGSISVFISDDTQVDYMRLDVSYCVRTDSGDELL